MKHKSVLLATCFLLCTGIAVLFAAPIAEDTYQKIQGTDLAAQDMDSIIEMYDDFYERLGKIAENARNDMLSARSEGDLTKYHEARDRYTALAEYVMSKEETDRLLGRILQEPEESQTPYAQWLYALSRHYRPTLTIDFSQQGDTYQYRFSQRFRQTPGSTVTLPDNTQLNTRMGLLAGWGITEDAVTYTPGQTIPMPITSQTLYAIWTKAVQFTDDVTQTEIIHEPVEDGTSVAVPQVSPVDSNYRFVGWYDTATRTLLTDETEYIVDGNGALFEGLYKHLSVDAISPLYYGFDRLPTDTQIAVGFSLANKGDLPLKGLSATLSTDSPLVTLVCDSLILRDLPAGRYRTNNSRIATTSQSTISGESNTFRLVIDKDAPSGSEIPLTLTVTDQDGERWSSTVSFTVR